MNSPPSSPPQPHAGNDNRDSDENYYIDVHDGSLMETYHVQGDIDNYEDHTPGIQIQQRSILRLNQVITRVPEIVTNDDTNNNAWEPDEESQV
ncbi:hypothetical protein BDD12DRAFT_876348 [Trichophaea hybrida]|nr:hypothetical protein BDD12DRAFT_876348 [Trichophaea hybrida]